MQGLITGVASAATSLVASTAPRERMGYAMGVMQTALWAGVSVGPVLGGLFEYAFGYRAAFVLTAVLLGVAGVLVSTLVRESFTPHPRTERGVVGGMGAAFAHVLRAPGVGVVFLVRFSAWLGRTMIVPFLPLFVTGLMAGAATVGHRHRAGDRRRVGHRDVHVDRARQARRPHRPPTDPDRRSVRHRHRVRPASPSSTLPGSWWRSTR